MVGLWSKVFRLSKRGSMPFVSGMKGEIWRRDVLGLDLVLACQCSISCHLFLPRPV